MSKLCECGCGALVAPDSRGRPRRFVNGHNMRKTEHAIIKPPSPEKLAYYNAKARCNNPNTKYWKHYGGRGIKFLFTAFEQFFTELGARPTGTTLDRKNSDGNYEVGNVRWATRSVQQTNRRNLKALMSKAAHARWSKR